VVGDEEHWSVARDPLESHHFDATKETATHETSEDDQDWAHPWGAYARAVTEAATGVPRAHVAASDCERIRSSFIAQPVNTASSLLFCAGGVWILRRSPRSGPRIALGAAAIAAGVGSVAYHGPGGRAARVAHDVTAVALAGALGSALVAPRTRVERRMAAFGCLTAAVAVHAASRTDRVLCRPDSLWQGHALWHALVTAAAVLAAD
jgi:hypothetical protein